MKLTIHSSRWGQAVLAAAATALLAPSASAAVAITSYSTGDLFIGFRQPGVADTLVVNLGSATQFIPSSITGGAWNGNPVTVSFGHIPAGEPGAGANVTSLALDLTDVFGSDWAFNDPENGGNDLSWAVVGITAKLSDNNPINGLAKRSSFSTIARTTPGQVAGIPTGFNTTQFANTVDSFETGTGGYAGRFSTLHSDKAYVGAATSSNNWATFFQSGIGFSSGKALEQPLSGLAAGPTNSFQDLYLIPASGSSLVNQPTYLGSFTLNESGQLTYLAVPEPGSFFLLGAATGFLSLRRRRQRPSATTAQPA